MSNHTPGPWEIKDSKNTRIRSSSCVIQTADEYGFSVFIASTVYSDTGYDVCHANAQLIAAAPELLQTLQNVFNHNLNLKPEYQISKSLMREIEQAIAKAEGRA